MCIILYQGHRWAGCNWLTCPPGRVLCMSLATPVGSSFATRALPPTPNPILFFQNQGQPQPNLYLAVPVPSQSAAKAPGLSRWARPLPLVFLVHMKVLVPYDAGPRLRSSPLCCLFLHSRFPASAVPQLQDGPEPSADQPGVLAYIFAHSLHAASIPGTTWSGAPGQEALGDLLV